MTNASQQLKIVHMTSVHRPFDVRIFAKECSSLAEHGYDVVLIAVHDHDELCDGVQIKSIPRPRSQWSRMIFTAWRVVLEALRQDADIYHCHDPELLPWTCLMRLLGRTVVYDMHENVPKDILDKTWLPQWSKPTVSRLVRLAERIFMWRLPVVFAESSYRDDYKWVRRSIVVLNLPRLDRLPTPSRSRLQPPRMAYIGGVATDRGSVVTVRALELLQRQDCDVVFRCVGPMWPPDHQQELEQLAVDVPSDRLEFFGYRPSSEGWNLIRDCQIGLAVLAARPNLMESFPTKLFEYMALEMPVIASDFPLYREVVETSGCGICVDPTSPQQLAAAVASLVRDPERASRMGLSGRKAVEERYNWRTEQGKLEQFYEQLSQSNRGFMIRQRKPNQTEDDTAHTTSEPI